MRRTFVIASTVLVIACGRWLGFSDDDESPRAPSAASNDAGEARVATDAAGTVPIDAAPPPAACDGGRCERLVFVTSALYTGDLDGVAGADTKCMALAGAGGTALADRTFVALLSVGGSDARTRISSGPPFRRVDGTVVAKGDALLNDGGTLAAPIALDERGVAHAEDAVWTGTNAFGRHYPPYDCAGWTTAQAEAKGVTGVTWSAGVMDGSWLLNSVDGCNQPRRLYCVEP